MEQHKRFVYRDRWRWIEAPPASAEMDIEGFAIECRVSISNAEVRGFQQAVQENDGKRLMRTADYLTMLAEINKGREAIRENADLTPEERRKAFEASRDKNAAESDKFRDDLMLIDRDLWELAASHIRAWNAATLDDNDEVVDVPAPSIGGVESFDALDPQMASWAAHVVVDAYRQGKAVSGPSKQPASTPELTQEQSDGSETEGE